MVGRSRLRYVAAAAIVVSLIYVIASRSLSQTSGGNALPRAPDEINVDLSLVRLKLALFLEIISTPFQFNPSLSIRLYS